MNPLKHPKLLDVCVCIALSLVAGNSAAAQSDRGPVTVEEGLKAPTLAPYSPPAFSPDGRFLAYGVTDNARRRKAVRDDDLLRSGVAWYAVASDIWVSELKTG